MNTNASAEAIRRVLVERTLQDEKWGDQGHHSDILWATLLARQAGHMVDMIVDNYFGRTHTWDELLKEAAQVAAVSMAHLEALIVRHERGDEL